jgi:hypothetical protein
MNIFEVIKNSLALILILFILLPILISILVGVITKSYYRAKAQVANELKNKSK